MHWGSIAILVIRSHKSHWYSAQNMEALQIPRNTDKIPFTTDTRSASKHELPETQDWFIAPATIGIDKNTMAFIPQAF